MRNIGAHVSASGGIDKAVERAAAMEANVVQLFSGSPRVWARTDSSKIDLKKVAAKRASLHVSSIFTHSLYLVNLASDNPNLVEKSFAALKSDLEFDSLINGSGIIVHLGSHQGRGWEIVREQVAEQIKKLLAVTPSDSTFLIENSAGQNGKLCSDLADIRWLLDLVASPRLGWCFDTCHGFAAGYSLGETAEPSLTGKNETAQAAITRLDLWSTLKIVHTNDSRDPFASGRDRHENIGDGLIPTKDLGYFLKQAVPEDVALVLEVPGIEGNGPDLENIQRLKALVA